MRRSLVLVLAVIGCAYDAMGQGSGPGLGTGSSSEGGTTVEQAGSSSTTAAPEGSGSGSTSSTGSSTGTPPEPDTGSTGEPPKPLPTARSCKEILELDPSAATGVHAILHERDGVAVDVHCEMELDGGGWTLVARTGPGPKAPFGWGVPVGMLGDENNPYSLDAMGLGLPFTEVLLTRRSGFATPVENAYVMEVPPGFLEDYRDQAYQPNGARTVLGDCAPGSGPTMLRWLGYTDDVEKYFFRDFSGNDPYGVYSDRLRTLYDDCDQGGGLDEEQGALFVR